MGKTRNTGYLQNIIQYDGSNNIILPALVGTGTRMVVAAANGTLSYQDIPTVSNIGGVPTTRTITINGTSQDLSANRTWTLYTDDISEDGSPVNLWFTNARARAAISVSGSLSYDSATGVISYTTPSTTGITEGSNLYYTDARVGTYLTNNSYATQNYVSTAISNLVNSAPATLDTLNELATALGNDPNFATTISTALGNRLRVDINTQGLTSTQKGYGRTNLGVVIGTDVQAYDADLDAIAALSETSGFLKKTAANTWTLDTNTYVTGGPYLPLTGGTLTGALSGTSATFSGNVRKTGAAGVYTELQYDGVYATGTDLYLLAPSTKGVYIYTNNTQALLISSTGTATFSGQVQTNNSFYVVGTPPATNGGLVNVRDTVTATNVTSFAGVFFNSAPGNDYSIGKLTENNVGFLQIRNGNNGNELLRINASGAATFSSSVTAESGYFNRPAATNGTSLIVRQTTAGGNGNQDIGLLVDIQGANDLDRILNLRYYDGTTYTSRFAVRRNGTVGINTTTFNEYLNIGNGGAIGWQSTSNVQKWHVQYNTNNDGLNFVESNVADYRLFLKAGGAIGINTASPGARLEVKANSSYAPADQSNIKLTNTGYRNDDLSSYGEGGYLDFYFENYNDAYGGTVYDRVLDIVVKGSPDGTYGKGVIRFKANPKTAGSNATEIMRIQGDNKVVVKGAFRVSGGTITVNDPGVSDFSISYSSGKTQFGMDSAGTDGFYFRSYSSGAYADRFIIKSSGEVNVRGTILPVSDATYNLGSTSLRWNNIYTTDLHLSNAGSQNIVDGTWGDWTLQEGENDIFMINNRSGDKYKIKLEKI